MGGEKGARLPLGFESFAQLGQFSRELVLAIAREGARAEAHVIGTAATGYSMNLAKPEGSAFSPTSDIDVVLRSAELLMKMQHAGGEPDRSWSYLGKYVWLRNDGPTGFLTVCSHVRAFAEKWSQELRRPVDLRLLLAIPGAPSHVDEFLGHQNPIELWPMSIYAQERERIVVALPCRVTVTAASLRIENAEGQSMGLDWKDLDDVAIHTTDRGPVEDDVFWVLGSGNTEVHIPQGADGEKALVDKLSALPGFDHEAMIAAMQSTGDADFPCWKRAAE